MSQIILKTNIKREEGYLYFCGTDDDGYITIGKAAMQHGRKEKKNETKL